MDKFFSKHGQNSQYGLHCVLLTIMSPKTAHSKLYSKNILDAFNKLFAFGMLWQILITSNFLNFSFLNFCKFSQFVFFLNICAVFTNSYQIVLEFFSNFPKILPNFLRIPLKFFLNFSHFENFLILYFLVLFTFLLNNFFETVVLFPPNLF